MRIIISGDDLLEFKSVVLTTKGRTWTKLSRSPSGHSKSGWYSYGCDPLHSRDLADGKPIVVLFDAGAPTESLDALVGLAQRAVDEGDLLGEDLAAYDFMVCWNRQHRYPELGVGRHLFEIPVRAQED